jgi:hypothetical protein
MKKLLITVSLVTLFFVSFGQKVDLDKFNFTYEYRDLPKVPLNPEYRTFSLKFNATGSVRDNFGGTALEDAVNVQGWKKVTGTGHIVATVTLDDLTINSSQVTERVDIQKDKDGKETGRKYYYKAEMSYVWGGKVVVKDYKEAAVGNTSFDGLTSSWASSEYSTRKEAADYYNNNREEIKGKLLRDKVNTALSDLGKWMTNNYGFPVRKDAEILWILDAKKHPEYQAQHDAWDTFKKAVATITADNLSPETKEQFNTLIKYFDDIPTRFATDDKNDKKMRYASFYNKAKIYLYLDNPEAAIAEADKLAANDYDTGDAKGLKKEADALIQLFKKNNATSRHFVIDLSNVQPPASN